MITHNEIVTGLWGLIWAGTVAGGALAGHWWWPSRRRLDDARDDGRGDMIDQAIERVREGMVFRLSPDGAPVWCDAGSQWDLDGAELNSSFKNVPRPGGEYARSSRDTPLLSSGPGHLDVDEIGQGVAYPVRGAYPAPETGEQPPPADLIHPAGRTIYPELAALAAESDAEPPLRLDPNWYATGLHWLADWQAQWHTEAAEFDAWLPGYLDYLRDALEPSWSRASRMLEEAMR